MGGWKLEVGKMVIYMAFPVISFYLFNQPQLFEDWVLQMKREMYPPENPEDRRLLQEAIAKFNKKQELKALQALEENSR